MPKWAWWVIGVIAAVLVLHHPASSGHSVGAAVNALFTFIGSL
jgi:bacteriorhodopsin